MEVGFCFPGEVCKVILQRPERGEALWLAIHPRGWIKVTWCFRFVDVKNVCFFWLLEMCDPARFVLRMEQRMWFLAENISFYPLCPTRVGHIGPFECVSAAFSLLPPVYPVRSYRPTESDIPTPVTIFFSCTALCLLGISRPPIASTSTWPTHLLSQSSGLPCSQPGHTVGLAMAHLSTAFFWLLRLLLGISRPFMASTWRQIPRFYILSLDPAQSPLGLIQSCSLQSSGQPTYYLRISANLATSYHTLLPHVTCSVAASDSVLLFNLLSSLASSTCS